LISSAEVLVIQSFHNIGVVCFKPCLPSTTLNEFVCFFICLCSFSPHSTILGRAEKRVNQVFTVPVEDSGNEDLYSYFSDIVAFIDDHRMPDGHTVLLSSILGISRSVTVAIAYCMWSKKLALKDAYNHVKKCKENMQPTRGFIEQLSRWEEKLFGSTVTDITEPNY